MHKIAVHTIVNGGITHQKPQKQQKKIDTAQQYIIT